MIEIPHLVTFRENNFTKRVWFWVSLSLNHIPRGIDPNLQSLVLNLTISYTSFIMCNLSVSFLYFTIPFLEVNQILIFQYVIDIDLENGPQKKVFSRNSMRTSVISWRTSMYTQTIFNTSFSIYKHLLRN